MRFILDALYILAAVVMAPWWARKSRRGWRERFGIREPLPPADAPRLLIHGVSVGEINLVRTLVDRLIADENRHVQVVVSASTDTGLARAEALYSDRCAVVRYPLDVSGAVRRFLDAVEPDGVVLAELELWPNFLRECRRRRIPIGVINGRLSERSFRGYRLLRLYLRRCFAQLRFVGAQDECYAARFRSMGVEAERCVVTGTMKWDSAQCDIDPMAIDALGCAMGIDRTRPLVVAGSTSPEEHPLLRDALPEGAQLLCAPRRPEWFDQAARDLEGCRRRSRPNKAPGATNLFLLDTIGELRAAYAMGDVVVVGRSFGDLHGSDPMEPAALSKPIIIGPAVEDFRATVDAMRERGAILQVDADALAPTLERLIGSPEERERLGESARRCVLEHQGATDHTIQLIEAMMASNRPTRVGDDGPRRLSEAV